MTGEGEETLTDDNLPPRLFATNRYPTGRLNAYSKPDIIAFVQDKLRGRPELQIIKDSQFGKLFEFPIYLSSISGKLLHGLITRQLVTKKRYEMWTVFGGQPLRFSLTEFGHFSGLSCLEFPDEYDPDFMPKEKKTPSNFWVKLIGPDLNVSLTELGLQLNDLTDMPSWRIIGIALILLVDGVLIASHQYHKPTPKYVDMVEDIDTFLAHPWGRESFLKTMPYLKPQEKINGVPKDPIKQFIVQLKTQKTFCLKGFPLILQLTAFYSIPLLLAKIPTSFRKQLINELYQVSTIPKIAPLKLTDIEVIENNTLLSVKPTWDNQPGVRDGWALVDTEYNDKKVDYLERLIGENHTFKIEHWHGGDMSLPLKAPKQPPKPLKQKQHLSVGQSKKTPSKLSVRRSKSTKKTSNRKQSVVTEYYTRSRAHTSQHDVSDLIAKVNDLTTQLQDATKRIKRLENVHKKSHMRWKTRLITRRASYANRQTRTSKNRRMGAAKEPTTEPVINLSSNAGLPPQWSDNSSAREDSADSKSSSSKQTRPKRSLSESNQHDGQPSPGASSTPTKSPRSLDPSFSNPQDQETTSSNVSKLNTPPLHVEATSPNTLKQTSGNAQTSYQSPPTNNAQSDTPNITPTPLVVLSHKDRSNRQLGEVTEMLHSSIDIVQPTIDVCPQKRRVDHNEITLPFKKPLLQDELAACTTQLFKQVADGKEAEEKQNSPSTSTLLQTANNQALSTYIVHEAVKEQQVDIDTSKTDAVTYLSDSSPPPVFKKYETTQEENELATLLLGTADPLEGDLTPHLDNDLFAAFVKTLEKHPFVRHITADNFTFDNAFILVLATPEAWISNLHMEVLLHHLGEKHAQVLKIERSYFASPWLATHISGKYRSFKAAFNKDNIRIDARITALVTQPGQVWLDDVDTVYTTMIWDNQHWVGLAINLKLAYIEVLDPDTSLYKLDKVGKLMEPLTEMLPHIITKAANNDHAQTHTHKQWTWKRECFNKKISNSGNCGPLSLKFLELHAYGDPSPTMSGITDDMIRIYRKEYAIDLYKHRVLPIYN